jgi:N-acyl-D-amino-acid deacylase
MFDLLIRNGTVMDGTGKAGFTADVGVIGDAISEIGVIPAEAQAARTLDATGQVVAPGFIDIHTHADIALLARPDHLPKVMQGVTTEVFTNCGLGFAPVTAEGLEIQHRYIAGLFGNDENVTWNWRTVADFLSQYEAQGSGANIAYLIPHGSVRVSAMGMAERPADSAELNRMQSMVEQGMEEGAWGLSTGIWYAPMRSAAREEMVTLCRAAGFFATHQRDYGDRIFEATEESLAIAREAEVPVQIAHLQMNGPGNAGRAPELLALRASR